MAKTMKFKKLVLKSFCNKFPGTTEEEQIECLITDPMIIQIVLKNRKEKFFIDKDKESIELLKIILAKEKVFVQQYDEPDNGACSQVIDISIVRDFCMVNSPIVVDCFLVMELFIMSSTMMEYLNSY